jgi:superfamily II helicase
MVVGVDGKMICEICGKEDEICGLFISKNSGRLKDVLLCRDCADKVVNFIDSLKASK